MLSLMLTYFILSTKRLRTHLSHDTNTIIASAKIV